MRSLNGSNPLVALQEYSRLKDLRKGSISRISLRKMHMKFEETGYLGVLPRRGRKPAWTESVEVATAVVKRASSSVYSSASG
ncbi:hypothetical protein TNCV_538431 [Trichonephila clavipes]|nr:hypothetical protein TNCV_538431 [Trichonephila clavipes]